MLKMNVSVDDLTNIFIGRRLTGLAYRDKECTCAEEGEDPEDVECECGAENLRDAIGHIIVKVVFGAKDADGDPMITLRVDNGTEVTAYLSEQIETEFVPHLPEEDIRDYLLKTLDTE